MIRKIHLIRHGSTVGNENRWYYGSTELLLTEKGKEEISRLKAEGIYPAAEGLVFTSGMERCRQTLELIYGDVRSIDVPELREMKFGIFECHSHEELLGTPEYSMWCGNQTGDYAMTGGESRNQYIERVEAGFRYLLGQEGDIVCICHGGTIARIMYQFYDQSGEENIFKWSVEPGRGYTLHILDGSIIGYEKI